MKVNIGIGSTVGDGGRTPATATFFWVAISKDSRCSLCSVIQVDEIDESMLLQNNADIWFRRHLFNVFSFLKIADVSDLDSFTFASSTLAIELCHEAYAVLRHMRKGCLLDVYAGCVAGLF